jgi:protoheme IX farnesyltransferase
MLVNTQKPSAFSLFMSDFLLLTKSRLTLTVVFSSIAGYLLAAPVPSPWHILLLSLGGYGLAGASNAFNQIIEKDIDAKMKRTQNRPIPKDRMSTQTAFAIATTLLIIGLVILYGFNPKTAMFGAISVFFTAAPIHRLRRSHRFLYLLGPFQVQFLLCWAGFRLREVLVLNQESCL